MSKNIQQVKQKFGVIGNSLSLNRAIEVCIEVALTDLSILVTGQSGVGKEVIPKIIHQLSSRKHSNYIAINCGAIPEGTIDSELFGHEKGSFTGAYDNRKGYFEVADGGTIFLDEVAELPVTTQVRLLRVLETGEFIKVGASKAQKTNVRIVAATNVNIPKAISKGKFREDLYYRLNTVPIYLPALRERKEDIGLLFRKFAADFSDKHKIVKPVLDEEAIIKLENYSWPGNIRQLKNVAEQVTIIEQKKSISSEILSRYLPDNKQGNLPIVYSNSNASEGMTDRDILYKILFDLREEVVNLKKVVFDIINNSDKNIEENSSTFSSFKGVVENTSGVNIAFPKNNWRENLGEENVQELSESFLLVDAERKLIIKALSKFKGKRKIAAKELGISERTLYRKIKEYNLEETD